MRNGNKRGEKILSIYWFAILLIVAGAIVYMVVTFYGSPYDAREQEANFLIDKIAGCISENGNLIEENLDKESFTENCDLNLETEEFGDWNEQGQYYYEVEIRGFASNVFRFEASDGNSNLKDFCRISGDELPKCVERQFYSLGEEDNYRVRIMGVVNKNEKN